jgi:hypothetical protein
MNRRILVLGGILAVIAVTVMVTLRILGLAEHDEFVEALWKVMAVIAVLTGASMLVSRLTGSAGR